MRLHRRSLQFPNFTVARHVSRPRIGRTPFPPRTKHERPGDPIELLESQIHPRQSIMESTAHAISRYRGRPTRTRPGTCILFLLGERYKGTRALSATGLLFMGRRESEGAWVYVFGPGSPDEGRLLKNGPGSSFRSRISRSPDIVAARDAAFFTLRRAQSIGASEWYVH